MAVSPSPNGHSDTCRIEDPVPGGRPSSLVTVDVDLLLPVIISGTACHVEETSGKLTPCRTKGRSVPVLLCYPALAGSTYGLSSTATAGTDYDGLQSGGADSRIGFRLRLGHCGAGSYPP